MRVLVTGAAGRIGGQLVAALRARGDWVRGFDERPPRPDSAPDGAPDDVQVGSLLDPTALSRALEGVEAVVHLAALMSWLPQDADRLFAVNTQGTFNLLQAVTGQGVLPRFIFASSGEVYPELNPVYQPIDENHPTRPISVYGLTKLLGEEMVQHFGRRTGLAWCILRFAHTQQASELRDPTSFFSGPRFYVNAKLRQLRALPPSPPVEKSIAALEAVARPEEQHYIGCSPEGRPYRMCICDVRDMISGILLALDHPAAGGELFNIGPASAFDFDQAVSYLARATGLPIVHVNLHTQPYHYETSIDKARQVLGYEPQYTIYRMIDQSYDD
jgi:UDP-glucose 4-epimerase